MSVALEQLVNDVVEVTGAPRPSLFEEDAPVLEESALLDAATADDPQAGGGLYFIGLIGGKEVGKSALVNAIVGRQITLSTNFGEGTQIVTAYCHSSQAAPVRELLEREVPGSFAIVMHENPRLVRQVLLDLPDIDSHWENHVLITRKMLRHMLFPLWIQSVEKYADLVPQQMLARVAAGNAAQNFIFCLNKVDQVVAAEGPEAAAELRDDYAQRLQRVLKLADPPRVYLVSAVQPEQHDLPQLRQLLGTQKTRQDVQRSQQAAARQRQSTVLGWLDRQDLPRRAEALGRLEEDADELLAARLGAPILDQCIPAMLDDPAHRMTILDDCLRQRSARWPFVGVVHSLLAPLTSIFRRRLTSREEQSLQGPHALVEAYLKIDGHALGSAIQTTFAQLQQSNPLVSGLFAARKYWEARQADRAASELTRRLADTVSRQRAIIIERVCGKAGVIGHFFRIALTIGALLWFPIVQPIVETLLNPSMPGGLQHALYTVVKALSVTFLFQTLTFLILWFIVIWALLRWDTQRRIERQIARWKSADAVDAALSLPGQTVEWLEQLASPIRAHRQKIEALVRRTEELKAALDEQREQSQAA